MALTRIYRAQRPDVVHHVAWKAIVHGGLAARRSGVPCVVNTVAGLGYAFSSNRIKPRLVRMVLSQMVRRIARHPNVRFIVQNRDDEALIQKLGVQRDQVVLINGSGVDLRKFVPLDEPTGTPIVVLPSRLLWSKGVGEFVEAARRLKEQGVVARFALVGSADPENPDSVPQDALKSWSDGGIVEWWGWRSDMPDVLAKAHIVVLPSKYREGVPRILLEAAASGRPVITTDAPGCRDAVKDGLSGRLVPPGDVDSLVAAMRAVLEDSRLRKEMGRQGRLLMEAEFSLDVVVAKTLRLYDELLRKANR